MPFSPGAKRLSPLAIDAIKNWGGFRVDNVGAPDTDEDVPRARAADILSGRFTLARMPDGAPGREWPLYAGWNLIGWQEEGK